MSSRNRKVLSKVRRDKSYYVKECKDFLPIMEIVLPFSRTKWEMVEELHRDYYADKHRTLDSIQKKFNKLEKDSPPTGDPHCTDCVRRAKRLTNVLF